MRPYFLLVLCLFLAAAFRPLYAPAERVEPQMVTARQEEVKREFASLVSKLERLSRKLKSEDPARADVCREALRKVAAEAVDSLLDELLTLSREGKFGLALERSARVLAVLDELRALLEGGGDVERRLRAISGFISRIEGMIEKQRSLRKQLEGAKELPPLGGPQSVLAAETRTLGAEMEDAAFPESGSKVKLASDSMENAAVALRGSRRPSAAAAQDEALARLNEALAAAKRARDLLEAVKRARRLDELKKTLENLVNRQKAVLADTRAVDSTFRKSGSWTRFLLLKLSQAASGQAKLTGDCRSLAAAMKADDGDGVFSYLAGKAAEDSAAAEGKLRSNEPSPSGALPLQARVLRRLEAMLKGIEELMKAPTQEGGGGGGGGGGSSAVVLPLAQLVALRAEQEDIADGTARVCDMPPGPERDALREELSKRQEACAELLRRLLEEAVK